VARDFGNGRRFANCGYAAHAGALRFECLMHRKGVC
jgi:hypothetical protein